VIVELAVQQVSTGWFGISIGSFELGENKSVQAIHHGNRDPDIRLTFLHQQHLNTHVSSA
jgi:hypothetical protein